MGNPTPRACVKPGQVSSKLEPTKENTYHDVEAMDFGSGGPMAEACATTQLAAAVLVLHGEFSIVIDVITGFVARQKALAPEIEIISVDGVQGV